MVASREQVRQLLDEGLDYAAAGRRLGIPAGQAYLIATGVPADGSDTIPDEVMARRRDLLAVSQQLSNPPHVNPVSKDSVRQWLAARAAADEQMRAARQRHNAEPPEIRDPDDIDDAVTVLTRQHNQVKVLLKQLEALPSHTTGGSPEQMSARKSIVDMITVRLSEHETIEEEHFWPAVRRALPDGGELADGALQQEQEGKDTLTEMGRLDADSREFDELAEKLVLQLRKHVAYEEVVFLRMREAVPADELSDLGGKLLAAGKRAPTRPHRHAPKHPGPVVQAAAAGAAALDAARDAVGNRPAERKGKAEQQEAERQEAEQREAEQQEADQQEAGRREAERPEAERQEAERQEGGPQATGQQGSTRQGSGRRGTGRQGSGRKGSGRKGKGQ